MQLTRNADAFTVRAEIPVAVTPATAWRVLTDYNHLAEFVPDMQVSRLVGSKPLLLEQRGESGFLVFSVEIRVVLQLEEVPLERIGFRAIDGNLKRMQGEWRIVPAGEGIRLHYRADIDPDFWVPPLIGDSILKAHVERQISGVVKEMLRRQALGQDRAPPKP